MAAKSDWHYYKLLFPQRARVGLFFALVGSTLVSMMETAALLLLLPLLALLNGTAVEDPSLVVLWRFLGEPPRDRFLLYLVMLMLGAFAVKDLSTLAFRWWLLGFNARLSVSTSTHLLSYFLHSPYEMFKRRSPADILGSVGAAVGEFYQRTVGGAMSVITEFVSIIAVMAALVIVMPGPAAAIVVYFGLIGFAYLTWVKPRLHAASDSALKAAIKETAALLQSLGGIEEIKIRHAQDVFVGRVREAKEVSVKAARLSAFLSEMPKYLLEVMFIVGLGILIAISIGQDLLGMIALLAAAAFRFLPSISRLLASIAVVRAGEPYRKLLLAELRTEDAQGYPASKAIETGRLPLVDELRVEDVVFQYGDATEPVLDGVSLRVPAGTSTALVGGSGAGKTTLANLMLGLLTPTSGRIVADGVDIADRMAAWQNGVGFVPQDVFHADLSFEENIAFDQLPGEIDQDRLWRAVEQAQLADVVRALPDGLKTGVGDHATRLSGGQRQRIGIARALYRDPSFLLLDEATSALDNETEQQITETLSALHGQLTIVVIAHRLSTVRDVDQIVLLEDGRVTGIGTFSELVSSSPYFARMVELGRLDA